MFKPFTPKISMHILHTVLYTFPLGTDKENLLENQELLYGVSDHFLHSHGLNQGRPGFLGIRYSGAF